jgi:cobalt/nickel transport system ATP-binding protein
MGLEAGDPKNRQALAASLGVLFQNSDDQVFQATVQDDVAFGPLNLGLSASETTLRVQDALRQVGMEGHEGRVPYQLSGGEKRRVALAGILAMRPNILLLDEPSVFLDPRGRRELITQLASLGRTQLIASHDLDLVLRSCQRVVILDGGKLVADGPVQQVLGDEALMEGHGLEVPPRLRGC